MDFSADIRRLVGQALLQKLPIAMGCSSSIVQHPPGTNFGDSREMRLEDRQVSWQQQEKKHHHQQQQENLLDLNQQQQHEPQEDILDLKQQQLVRETWRQLQERRATLGKQVFLRIFEEDPSIKAAFNLTATWGDNLITDTAFQKQAARFGDTIDYVVDNIERLSTDVAPYLIAVGVYHADNTGFVAQHFDIMVKPFLFVWEKELGESFTPGAKHAWRTLLQHMVDKMKKGRLNATKNADTGKQT